MFEVVFDYGEHDRPSPDAGSTPATGLPRRSVLHLPRRLRGAHLPAVPARADVPPLPGRGRRRRRLPGALAPTSPTRTSTTPADARATRSTASCTRSPRPATSATTAAIDSAACRRSSSSTPSRSCSDGRASVDAEQPGEPARRPRRRGYQLDRPGRRGHLPASSPSRPAPGSTSATSARSARRPTVRARCERVARQAVARRARPAAGSSSWTWPATASSTWSMLDGADCPASTSTTTTRAGSRSGRSPRCPTVDWDDPNLQLRRPRRRRPRRRADHRGRRLHLARVAGRGRLRPGASACASRSTRRKARASSSPTARSPSTSPTCPATG